MNDVIQHPLLLCILSFLAMWGAARLGARFGGVLKETHDDFGVILTATLTLLALIVGFTFSMAVSRYEQRKLDEEQEANAIGTEYLRADLLPAPDARNLRRLLREYLDQRILFYKTRNRQQLRRVDADTAVLQGRLWEGVRGPSLAEQTPLKTLVVSGMNDVVNSQGYTQAAWWNRIPVEAWGLMGIIAAGGNLMVGLYLGGAPPRGKLLLVLPALVSVSLFLIADIDSPRNGLIHVSPDNLSSVARALQS